MRLRNSSAPPTTTTPGARTRYIGPKTGTAITGVLAIALVPLAVPAYAATPPAAPNEIVVFPDRDFVSIDGYQGRVGQNATVTVTRGGVITGRAQGPIVAGSPALEVNHPGGSCWGTGAGAPNVTPDIKAGDVVAVSFAGVPADSSVTQSPAVTGVIHAAGSNRVVVNGTVGAPNGPVADGGRMEQRIIEPLMVGTDVARRDVRAVAGPLTPSPNGSYTSSLAFTATTFTATYVFNTAASADIAAAGEKRAMTWMATDAAANRLGMTIAEYELTGGPGMGGCPQGPASTPPNAPANVSGISGDASLTATWSAATTIPGGSPVTGYTVEVQAAGNPDAPVFRRTAVAAATSVPVTGLTNGTAYSISVQASSAAGLGQSGTGGPITPSPVPTTAPGAPTIRTATAGNASATVNWTRPAGVVNSFDVQVISGGAVLRTVSGIAGTASSTVITGLANGTSYSFRVLARNIVGSSVLSAASNAVVPVVPTTVPGAPTGVSAAAGNATARVVWTAPANASTSAITGYRIRRYSGTGTTVLGTTTVGSTLRSATISGLANGTAVRFDATAVRGTTFGAVSARSNVVTPATTVPGAPVIGTSSPGAIGGAVNATARWTPPATDGGIAINGYVVTALRLDAAGTVLATTTSLVQPATARALVMALPAGNYRFTVRARNTKGLSVASARSANLVGAR